jgi:hypothetical protein
MHNLKFALSFVLFMLLTPAFSQTASIRLTIPFGFTVGDQRLPAGDYRASISYDSILQIVSTDRSNVATALTTHVAKGTKSDRIPRLIFHRYGNHFFLAQAWIGEVEVGHQLFTSSAELDYARTMKQEQTVVAAARLPQ